MKKKIALFTPYCILPPTGGGKARIFNLYKYLSSYFDISMLSLQQKEVISDISTEFITETFKQTTVPKTPKHQKEDDRIDINVKVLTFMTLL